MKKLSAHLDVLENESIEILREVVASFERIVFLYSVGKDSSVLLHLIRKAFFPAPIPFPVLHIDTTWKFSSMISFRDETVAQLGLHLIVHTNEEGVRRNINPFDHDPTVYTEIMKGEALRQALSCGRFDCAIGGARRDEEKSRAKERIFSVRTGMHSWNPRAQRPELWNLYNTKLLKSESMRVFPLSNWTELDVWQYIAAERIPIVELYFAKFRPVVERQGRLIMVDDDRFRLQPGETAHPEMIRFRTLGCYPLTAAVRSNASTIEEIVREVRDARVSERDGRIVDLAQSQSMEKLKVQGYF